MKSKPKRERRRSSVLARIEFRDDPSVLLAKRQLLMISVLSDTFRLFPIGGASLSMAETQKVLAIGAEMFRIGLHLALPFIAVLLIVNLALGVMMRVAPQLNLMSVGMPATITIGFASLFLMLPYLEQPITRALERSVSALVS